MTAIRRADPAARRHAVLLVLVCALVGVLLIVSFERYRIPLRDWILADPETSAHRVKSVFLLVAALVLAPLLTLAGYLWSLGARVLRAEEFPPPGYRVIRDTPVITGEAAMSRGCHLKALAVGCGISSALLGVLLWRLASVFGDHAANIAFERATQQHWVPSKLRASAAAPLNSNV